MKRFKNIGLQTISLNTLFQFLIRIVTSIPTLIATILIAYYAGFETLGSFTKIVAFVSIFYLLVDFGMNSLFLKLHFNDAKNKLGNLLLLRVVVAVLLLPIIYLLTFLLPHNTLTETGFTSFEKEGIMIYSLTIIATGLTTSLQAYLQKKLSYSLSFLPTLFSSLVLLSIIIFAAKQQNLHLLLLSYVISGSVLFVSLYFVLQNKYSLKLKTSNLQSFSKTLLIASFPLGLMLLFNLLYAKVDTLILSFFRPTAEVGIYGIAYKFFDVSIAIPAFLSNSVYPLLLRKQNDQKGYQMLMKKYTSLFVLVSLVVTFSVLFLSPLIALLKADFAKSVLPLQLLSLSLPFFFLTSLLQWHFLIKNKIKFLVPLYAFSLLLNIVLNIIFIPIFSYYAAAIITGISEALVFLSMLWYFVKSKKA